MLLNGRVAKLADLKRGDAVTGTYLAYVERGISSVGIAMTVSVSRPGTKAEIFDRWGKTQPREKTKRPAPSARE